MKCSKCKTIKELSDFPKDKTTKKGYKAFCKDCASAMTLKWGRSEAGVIIKAWHHQVQHSITRGHQPPKYTREEFVEWMLNHPSFTRLFAEWVESGYIKDVRPSVDRLDNSYGYSFDNIRLVTFRENYMQYHNDKVSGIEKGDCKAIRKITKDGEVVGEYFSVAEALRQHGKKPNNARISAVLTGSRKYYLKHRWEYMKWK